MKYSRLSTDNEVPEESTESLEQGLQLSNVPPETFRRSQHKFWVCPHNLHKVYHAVMAQLPFSSRGSVHSLYFDNDALECYRERTLKQSNATLLRLRWYGGDKPHEVFVERKVHQVGTLSTKQRIQCTPDDAFRIQNATAAAGDSHEFAFDIAELIRTRNLKPVTRTEYHRTAFQSEDFRVSIDEKLWSTPAGDCNNVSQLFGSAFVTGQGDDLHHFPFAIIEFKDPRQKDAAIPSWLSNLVGDGTLLPANSFSKFANSVVHVLPKTVPFSPPWLKDLDLITDTTTKPRMVNTQQLVSVAKIDARTFLALERTLFSWVRSASMMGFGGLYMIGQGYVFGTPFVVANLIMVAVAVRVYHKRLQDLKQRLVSEVFIQSWVPISVVLMSSLVILAAFIAQDAHILTSKAVWGC